MRKLRSLISKGIRFGTRGDFSHAILYVGGSSYIHSDSTGVHSGNTQRLLFNKKSEVVILRNINLSENEKNSICNYARNNIGKEYSVKEAIKTVMPKLKINLDRQFCSRLVAQSYSASHANIVKDINYCSPQEIYESEQLIVIDDAIRIASKKEVEFSKSKNPIEEQENITNKLLSQVRKLTGKDIQTINEIWTFLEANQTYDLKITDIMKKFGYLTMYKYELEQNPWRYNKKKFLKLSMSKQKLLDLAYFELNLFEDNKLRYSNMFNTYFTLAQRYSLDYLSLNIDLYKTLLDNIYLQESTMRQVVEHLE